MVDVVFIRAFGSWLIVLLNIVFTYKQNESELIILITVNYNGEFVKNLARGGGTWVFFRWVCAARDSKLALRSRKNFP